MSHSTEQWKAERAARLARERERRQRELNTDVSVTWLDPPVTVGRIRVVGVASDASDECKRTYGVRV